MTGFSELDTVFHRLLVTNLTDQDDVGRLPQGVLESRVPGLGIHTNFALRNDATFMRMHVLDRVLDRDDMAARILVAMTDHCRERCRLTRTRAADDDAKAALVHDDVFEDGRQLQILERRDFGGDGS